MLGIEAKSLFVEGKHSALVLHPHPALKVLGFAFQSKSCRDGFSFLHTKEQNLFISEAVNLPDPELPEVYFN